MKALWIGIALGAAVLSAPAAMAAADGQTWAYSTSTDKMRGTTTEDATLKSINGPSLREMSSNVYVPHTMTMMAIKSGGELNAGLVFVNLHLDCPLNKCKVAVKFDDSPVEDIEIYRSIQLSGDTAVVLTPGFVEKVKASHHLFMEIPLSDTGAYQYEFNTGGLLFPSDVGALGTMSAPEIH